MKRKYLVWIIFLIISSLNFLQSRLNLFQQTYGFFFTLIGLSWLYAMFTFEYYLTKEGVFGSRDFSIVKMFSFGHGRRLWKEILRPSIKNDKVHRKYLLRARVMTIVVIIMMIVTAIVWPLPSNLS